MNHAKAAQRRLEMALAIEAGEPSASVEARFDVTRNTVYKACAEFLGDVTPIDVRSARKKAILAEIASLGVSQKVASGALGIAPASLSQMAKRLGVKFVHGSKRHGLDPRAAQMAALYRSGQTLQQIGEKFSLTRERVRQIMTHNLGMNNKSGGQHVHSVANRQARAAAKDARYLAKYGCTFNQYVEARSLGRAMLKAGAGVYQTPLRAWMNQRNNAKSRGIGWELTFWQWWTIWQESGKWEHRGRARDLFVMSRLADKGAYAPGNVYIGTLAENSAIQPNNPYRKDHPDHDKVMPAVIAKQRLTWERKARSAGDVNGAYKNSEAA